MNRFENGMYSFQKTLNALNQLSTHQDDIAGSDAEYIMRDAVMFFHHSIETLFKDILHDKCPILDAGNIQLEINRRYDKQMGKEIEKRNIEYSSTFLETVKRMTVICSLQMDEYLYEKFERLNEIRNACTHNEMDLMCVHAEKLVLELFPVVVWILERNLLDPKRELFEQYMTTIQGSHAKWRIETLLSLYRLGADAMKNDRQNKLLLSLIGGRTPCLDNINETVFHEWLENQFCFTMLQVGENAWEEYRTAIKKTSDIEKAFKNFAKRFLKDTFTIISESSNDFSHLSVENCLYVLISLQEIQPIIALEAWIHHKNRFKDTRRAIKMENGQNLDEIHTKVSVWKNKHQFFLISQDDRKKYHELNCSTRLEKAIWESNEFIDYASAVINDDISVFDEIYGDYSGDSPIDRINEVIVEDVVAVKCDKVELQEYTVYLIVQLYTESYFDHEYFPNKVISGYMSICGVMQEELINTAGVPFEKKNVKWIGRLPNVVSYGLFHDYTEKSLQRSIFNREEHNGDEEE